MSRVALCRLLPFALDCDIFVLMALIDFCGRSLFAHKTGKESAGGCERTSLWGAV